MTSRHKDALMSQMTVLEDLTDLEATVTDTYINTLKEDSDPETLTLIEVESTASKNFATTTETAIKAATRVVKTVSDQLDERAARDHRVAHRAHSQEALNTEHHSDPLNKVNVASDLKPEQLCDSISQLELDDWCERGEVYAEASNITSQSNSVQLGYLQALVKPDMWHMYREYCEANHILPTDKDFEKGIELLKETYYKKNDVFLLKLKTPADTFRGKSYAELQTWFFKYRQSARNCGLSTMSEEEQFNFKLLASMTEKMKSTLFVQNARPSLQETLDFIDNQVIVENMIKTPTKKADTINNIRATQKSRQISNAGIVTVTTDDNTVQLTRSLSIAGGASSLAMLLKLVEGKEDPQGAHPGQDGQQDHLPHQHHHLLSQKQRRKEEEGEKRRKRKDDRERKRNPKTTRGSVLRPKPQHPPA